VGNDDNVTRVIPNNTSSSCRERKVEVELDSTNGHDIVALNTPLRVPDTSLRDRVLKIQVERS